MRRRRTTARCSERASSRCARTSHLVLAGGRALALSVRELELLAALAPARGRIVPREELYARCGAARCARDDRSVDVYVHKLRDEARRTRCRSWRFIHTHFGFGYRFSAGAFTRFSQGGDGS